METAALLVVLAAVGGVIVVRTVFRGQAAPAGARASVAAQAQSHEPVDRPAPGGRRRLLTAAALTDTLAIEGEEELRPSFFGRTLAFGRLILVILFICALAGGTLFWLAMMIASRAHIHPS
jgi:hypothetical protein